MSTRLQEAIQQVDIENIQTALLAYITSDPLDKSGEINSALQHIDEKGINIWDTHNKRDLIINPAEWTKSYFGKLQSHLITNFSKERFELLMKVGREAYKEELNHQEPVKSLPKKSQLTNETHITGGSSGVGKFLVTGVTIVALAAIVYLVVKKIL
ncbi:hypothetical protein PGC35_20170 [Psychrobacillus sp. PGGUH221]|uniref:hypothetical protein n=1 Tax=Psychrobacillus sp. PGGUH221 TaxID=3020058 RepID=UPI0035C710B3